MSQRAVATLTQASQYLPTHIVQFQLSYLGIRTVYNKEFRPSIRPSHNAYVNKLCLADSHDRIGDVITLVEVLTVWRNQEKKISLAYAVRYRYYLRKLLEEEESIARGKYV
jgi:hypothetical protein